MRAYAAHGHYVDWTNHSSSVGFKVSAFGAQWQLYPVESAPNACGVYGFSETRVQPED
jgi:hypothetical protein